MAFYQFIVGSEASCDLDSSRVICFCKAESATDAERKFYDHIIKFGLSEYGSEIECREIDEKCYCFYKLREDIEI